MGQCPTPKPCPDPKPTNKFGQFESISTLEQSLEQGQFPYILATAVCGNDGVAKIPDLEDNKVSKTDMCSTDKPYWVSFDGPSGVAFYPAAAYPQCGSIPVNQQDLGAKPLYFACSNTPSSYPPNLVKPRQ